MAAANTKKKQSGTSWRPGSLFKRLRGFLGEVRQELVKSTWPTRAEVWQSTQVVLVSVAILSVFVLLCDTFYRAILRIFFG